MLFSVTFTWNWYVILSKWTVMFCSRKVALLQKCLKPGSITRAWHIRAWIPDLILLTSSAHCLRHLLFSANSVALMKFLIYKMGRTSQNYCENILRSIVNSWHIVHKWWFVPSFLFPLSTALTLKVRSVFFLRKWSIILKAKKKKCTHIHIYCNCWW